MAFELTAPEPDLGGVRFRIFREVIQRFYLWRWNQDCPWDGSESNQLSRLLRANPTLDVMDFRRWLMNYGQSDDITPGERPRKFLPRIHDYSVTALDRFGRDQNAKSGETFAERDAKGTDSAIARVRENLNRAGSNGHTITQALDGKVDQSILARRKQLPSAGD